MEEKIKKLMEEDYKGFIKELLKIETGVIDNIKLENLYNNFIEKDNMNLLNDEFYS